MTPEQIQQFIANGGNPAQLAAILGAQQAPAIPHNMNDGNLSAPAGRPCARRHLPRLAAGPEDQAVDDAGLRLLDTARDAVGVDRQAHARGDSQHPRSQATHSRAAENVAYAYAVLTFALGETLALVPRGSVDYFLPANVLISNVRGPSEPLYLAGARLEARCPMSTLISGMGLNITFMSYDGQVVIGFTANASALPHAGRLAQYTREAFAALERQTGRARG